VNVAQLLVDGADRAQGGQAVVFGDRRLSYPALVDRVARLAAGFARLGVRVGDRIVVLLPNSVELVEALWASFWGGFVAVPVNRHLHPDEVGYVVRHCGAAAILVAAETEAATTGLPDEVRVLRVGPDVTTGIPYESLFAHAADEQVAVEDDDPAWLFYTSGTTGKPKGATLTHRNLAAMTSRYHTDLDPVASGSVYLHAAPLTHGSGLYLLPATGRGAPNVISPSPSFSPSDYLGLVEKHAVTHAAFLAPTMLTRLVAEAAASAHDLSTLRSVVVGGAPLYQEDLRAAVAVLGPLVIQMYGQGESPMTITVMPAAEALDHPGSCGRAFTGVEVRVAGRDGSPLAEGEDGEVLVRGAVVMRGYWDDPDATARALVGGWLHTGDIGHLDGGWLHLTDRAKDVIITGGSNVYPREVEEVLLTHPGVREAAVIGVPDPEWGESIRAFVVADTELDPGRLIDHCRAHLASFKKPRDVVFVSELPKNPAGKILKRELRVHPL
jgi:acyl-CoA synthetase (AMP-forming)/AMP-acid ligase II